MPIEVAREDGSIDGDAARLTDFNNMEANDWLAVNQFTVIEHEHNRRPDVVLFVNGLPLAVIELKNPGDGNATLECAFNQLQTYKDDIFSLFRTNAALMTSDGLQTRVGSLTANLERFMPWRTVDGSATAPKGTPELDTVIKGVFGNARFLALVRELTVFEDSGAGLVKIWQAITSSTPCAMRSSERWSPPAGLSPPRREDRPEAGKDASSPKGGVAIDPYRPSSRQQSHRAATRAPSLPIS